MPKAYDHCVQKVKRKGKGNPYAICRASMGSDKGARQKRRKRK